MLEFIFIVYLFLRISKREGILKKEITELKKKVNEFDELLPGDKVTFEEDLSIKNVSFRVLYEATVLDVSEKKIKVNPYGATPASVNWPDVVTKLPNYLRRIIDFYKGKWVDRSIVLQILSESDIRAKKISEVLND